MRNADMVAKPFEPIPQRARLSQRLQTAPGSAQSGLTLVELLVSMVILGFVLALVSEAVFQVSQVTRSAQAATASLTSRWSAGWAAGPMLANLVAPPEAAVRKAFEGSANELSAYTTLPVDGGQTGIQRFTMSLRPGDSGATQTELRVAVPTADARTSEPAAIGRFDGRAEFAYLDEAGAIVPVWPPMGVGVATSDPPADLPRAVIVRRPFSDELLMWYPYPGETRKPVPPSLPFESKP
ncbi:PilW family protein [Piscinibacter sakaiensis]|uniref:PilW family protein n=1 Tax=Piscinibacter sakaiensis TaxID=1547922 RepID=UPI003AAC5AC5